MQKCLPGSAYDYEFGRLYMQFIYNLVNNVPDINTPRRTSDNRKRQPITVKINIIIQKNFNENKI